MGGSNSAIDKDTKSIIIESGNFNPDIIRKTSNRIKKRTEASSRFEKSLDPNQNTNSILRYLKLLQEEGIKYKATESIVSIGNLMQDQIIELRHNLINSKIGSVISSSLVEEILLRLGFGFQAKYQNEDIIYTITIPTYRATKDITIAEDIIEEIARYIGYNSIVLEFPKRDMKPFNNHIVFKERYIKRHLAYALRMHETNSYSFYDDEFLSLIRFTPENAISIINPQSNNYNRLVTSLLVNLLKAAYINQHKSKELRFFELARVWFENYEKDKSKNITIEAKELAGIFINKDGIDFYDIKYQVDSIFKMLNIKNIRWVKQDSSILYNKDLACDIYYNDTIIGKAGILNNNITKRLLEYDVFAFEINAEFLLLFQENIIYTHISKYQDTDIDISLIAPLSMSTYNLQDIIKNSNKRIRDVFLIDFFQDTRWSLENERSLTFRINIQDSNKTLNKQEINGILDDIKNRLECLGVIIR
jgi:phenylalanyl-tRNA synthetase beta chain